MPPDDALLSRVREALAATPDVEEKRMFGGIAFMVRGKMCVSVGRDRIMCRIDPAMHDSAIQHDGCRTVVMKGREYRGYVYVDRDAVPTRKELEYWVGLSLEYNTTAKASRKRR